MTQEIYHNQSYPIKGVASAKDQQPVPDLPRELRTHFLRASNLKAMSPRAVERTRIEWAAQDALADRTSGAIDAKEFQKIGQELQRQAATLGLRLKRGASPDEARVVAVRVDVPPHGPRPGFWVFDRSTTGISQPSLFEAVGVVS